ncbi:peroxide stress protein YaaA [Lentzea sp. NBRC 105346]|uniref:peroxide stress protein YaaA n=1 Tax=Lentzea sp. NBRC 105346 TaxID=3032205 RepID=UPI0024A167A6|nr:peroxide stress protein YaaA [Lentzea sp. NBRC 105346]GLZ31212.1 peroxide stress protein YaaA [Lentzea sp. NBRC 105346]
MLVLLPPSETKAIGGDQSPLDLDRLSFPELNPTRDKLVTALVELARDEAASIKALEISAKQTDEVRRNAELRTSPALPALARYTGVLYDALGFATLTAAERARAQQKLAVASALFGVVRGADPIPAYRLSGGNTLPALGSLRTLWKPVLEPVLAQREDFVVDLRSGAYANLAKVPGAAQVRVLTEDGKVISHFNKAHKGLLARAIATSRAEPGDLKGLVKLAQKAGIDLRATGPHAADLIVH